MDKDFFESRNYATLLKDKPHSVKVRSSAWLQWNGLPLVKIEMFAHVEDIFKE